LRRHIAAELEFIFMANKKLYKKERFSGCIVGAAAGDALGSPVKTLTISQIKDLYGKKGILKLSSEKRQKTARISDETQMMLFTAHGILWADAAGLRTGEANCADYVFLALQQWLYSQTGGTSSIDLQWILDDNETGFPCDLLGISAFCKKRNPTKQLVQTLAGIKSENDYGRKRRPINQNKLFDCLPRAIPAGLYFYSDPELAFSVGCDLAAITHSHPTGYLATGCLSAIIAFICKGNTIERSVLNTMKILKEHDGFEECFAALDKALSLLDEETSPLTDVAELGNGSTADSALAIGVYCACVHYDYLSAVQLAANQDGISDICAFIAGALKGALLGYSEIPSGFVKKLQFAELIKDYAGRMTKAAPKGFMKK